MQPFTGGSELPLCACPGPDLRAVAIVGSHGFQERWHHRGQWLNDASQCDLLVLVTDLTYVQAVACGRHSRAFGARSLPKLAGGKKCGSERDLSALVANVTRPRVAAGRGHAVLPQSDSTAVACSLDVVIVTSLRRTRA